MSLVICERGAKKNVKILKFKEERTKLSSAEE